jgi:peptidoglycan/xylan/chitin deacetylase (PgdA/CDA1 family)
MATAPPSKPQTHTPGDTTSGRSGRRPGAAHVPILMYHAVADDIDASEAEWSVRPVAFEAQMRVLRDEGWTALTVSELCDFWARDVTPPSGSVVVTFDDGHACLHDIAMPIMQRYGIRSTLFAISGFLGRSSTYDASYGTVARAMMSRTQLCAMHAAGHEIGSHTVSHPDLRTLTPEHLRDELARSRQDLESLIGVPVCAFAYPHGWFDRAVHDAVVQAGYRCAVSVMCGPNTASTPRHLLRRINIGDHTTLDDFRRMLRHGGSPLGVAKALIRERTIRMVAALRGRDPMDLYMRPMQSLLA